MNLLKDPAMLCLLLGVFAALVIATVAGWLLKKRMRSEKSRAVLENFNARVRAWWILCLLFVATLWVGRLGSILLFALTSFLALREFITLTPTRPSDHAAIFWCFFVVLPFQYVLVGIEWYGLFSIFIPVYAFLFIPIRNAIKGDTSDFLARTATVQWGLMITVYCVSHVSALFILKIPGFEGQNAKLLFFLILVVQMSDVFQYLFGKWLGKRPIAPKVSPNKTWEGFIGGTLTATLMGTGLWWITPFKPLQAAGMALLLTLLGFFGGLVLSAVKRDRGVKDYGSIIQGHGGVMDRIDSLSFAAPIYFHLIRYFFTP
jgi:phosphatidate cytidylyltransferase